MSHDITARELNRLNAFRLGMDKIREELKSREAEKNLNKVKEEIAKRNGLF